MVVLIIQHQLLCHMFYHAPYNTIQYVHHDYCVSVIISLATWQWYYFEEIFMNFYLWSKFHEIFSKKFLIMFSVHSPRGTGIMQTMAWAPAYRPGVRQCKAAYYSYTAVSRPVYPLTPRWTTLPWLYDIFATNFAACTFRT